MENGRNLSTEPGEKRLGPQACLRCRSVKMKCLPLKDSQSCERCTRKSLDCVYHHKKRGRKPGTKVHQLSRRGGRGKGTSHQVIAPEQHGRVSPSPILSVRSRDSESEPVNHRPPIDDEDEDNDGENASTDFWNDSEGLQMSGLLNKQAMKGRFSLKNILSTSQNQQSESGNRIPPSPKEDPISMNLINYHIAGSLFDGFMRHLNPLVCVFDPVLHTFDYVRNQSPFLLTSILAASAKAFNSNLHPTLCKHAEELFSKSFRRCVKAPEVIQAILLMTYWKEPDDTRAWSSVGYAIRLCMELGWHRLSNDVDASTINEHSKRKKRNVERTWLNLFVYDRNMSLQTGKPWMIERSDFIESVNAWYKSELAVDNDSVLCAFVTLRLTTADIMEVFNPQRPMPFLNQTFRVSSILRTLNIQIDAWQKYWTRRTETDARHHFLVKFFSLHMRLLLYSFPLQKSLSAPVGGSLIDTEALWITYTSALDMLKLVTLPSSSQFICFVQDSIHVMTAYAAVFLIKLLLSVTKGIRDEIEESAIDAITAVSQVFAQQSTSPTSGCTLQATFLNNVLRQYAAGFEGQNIFTHLPGRHVGPQSQSSGHQGHGGENNCVASTNQTKIVPVSEQYRPQSPVLHANTISIIDGNSRRNAASSTERHALEQANQLIEPFIATTSGAPQWSPYDQEAQDSPFRNFNFMDNQMWTTMFANAGFSIDEGIFLPNSTD